MDLSFPKREHLCLKRRFDALLAQGKSFFIYPFRVIYLLKVQDPDLIPMQVAISVRKKQFKLAVTRNLIKRRFRESWRLHKSGLHTCLAKEGKSLYILVVYGASEVLTFSDMDMRLKQVIQRLQEVVITENVQ
jgi:ribonuclease P protein component